MSEDKEAKLWWLVAKVALGALLIVFGFGLGLWYAAKYQHPVPESPPETGWGIAKDSPIRSKR